MAARVLLSVSFYAYSSTAQDSNWSLRFRALAFFFETASAVWAAEGLAKSKQVARKRREMVFMEI